MNVKLEIPLRHDSDNTCATRERLTMSADEECQEVILKLDNPPREVAISAQDLRRAIRILLD